MKFKKIYVILVTSIFVAAFTPLVLAASEDSVVITFDPNGDIDIDISLASYAFGSIYANQWSNTTGGTFTLYNNGTVAMDTQIKTNATTDSAQMSLNASGVPPGTDKYAIYISGLDVGNYLTTAYSLEFDQGLLPADSKTFDICLRLGTNLSANFTTQTTTIYFQGSQS
jgi:hypothetical protein